MARDPGRRPDRSRLAIWTVEGGRESMDHDDALALIETAAAEPGGLDRLMAGDTPDAVLLAGHLADCRACTEELRRIGQTAQLVRSVVRDQPSPELKERTLAFLVFDIGWWDRSLLLRELLVKLGSARQA